MAKPSRWRTARIGAVLAVASVALAGCIGNNAGAGDTGNDGPVSTEIPSEPIELTLTDSTSLTAPALIEAFEAKYPNVTINYEPEQFNDYIKNIRLKMTSNDPPDIAAFQGPVNELIPGGYLLDLTPYEELYDWDATVSKAALDQWRLTEDAKTYGEGGLYAVPGAGLSIVGTWFNRVQLKQAGIDAPPTTLDELETDLAKAKAAGLQGIEVGALDTGAQQMLYVLLNALCPTADIQGWVFGHAGSTIDTDCARAAAQKILDWSKAGYLPATLTGIGHDDAAVAWAQGAAVFHFNGNWNTPAALEGLGDDAGFTLIQGENAAATGASGGYAASSKTKYPDVVAAFMNFMTTKEAAQIQIDGGLLPVDSSSVAMDTELQKEIGTAYQAVNQDNGLVQFLEYATPDMQDALTAGVQSLILQRMTADEFVKSLQKLWDAQHE
jgi:raffinose/stachyose/melibiose transport system substrate-binding protein